nr:sucrose synthase 2 [Tanacetum cinerariifolium]
EYVRVDANQLSVEQLTASEYLVFKEKLVGQLQGMGFERGWGNNDKRVLEMLHLLSDILQAPDTSILESVLARIPMVFNVVILSIHGYFGQANVLGLPDTSSQIIYILDQVCALENEMLLKLKHQGLDITPKILIVRTTSMRVDPFKQLPGSQSSPVFVVPLATKSYTIVIILFRTKKGTLRKWISRFDVWPYLEKFAEVN